LENESIVVGKNVGFVIKNGIFHKKGEL